VAAVQTVPVDPVTVSPVDNDFFPADRPFTDCVGLVERPGCGSEARGGFEQGILGGALVLALVFIGWRIVRAARRRPNVASRDAS